MTSVSVSRTSARALRDRIRRSQEKASASVEASPLYNRGMKSRIYVETSVVSFYHEVRTEPDMIARREWTRKFWDVAGEDYALLTSVAVLEELERGRFPNKREALDLVTASSQHRRDRPYRRSVYSTHGHARRPRRRCSTLGSRLVSQVRFPFNLELQTSGECEQIRSHS